MSMETVSTIGSRGGGKETVSTQPKLLGALRCRDYSRHTEQTYCQWVFQHENLWVSAKTGEQERHYVDDSIVQRARIYAFTILLVSALILSGCAPGPTGTIIEPDPEDISRIKKVGLCVKVQKGFAVRLGYVSNADRHWLEQMLVDNLGRFLGSLAYGGPFFGWLSEYSPDRNAGEALKPEAAPVDSAEAIGRALSRKFRTAKIFPAVEFVQPQSLAAAKEHGIDTLFILTVRRWGLRPPLRSKYATGDKAAAQLELGANHRLISSATGKVLWERNELYRDSKCYSLGDFKSQKGLLAIRMWYVLQLICDRTSNEIHRTP